MNARACRRWRRGCAGAALMAALALACAMASAAAAAAPAAAAPPQGLNIYATDIPPVAFQDGDHADGMLVEVAMLIQGRLGRHDAIQVVPWARAYAMEEKGPNVLLLGMVRTPQRERAGKITFVGPLFTSTAGVYARHGDAARLQALGDKIHQLRIGARRNSIFAELAHKQGYTDVDPTVNSEVAANMLLMRRFDLWVEGSEVVPSALQRNGYLPSDVELVTTLGSVDVYFAFSAGTPAATSKAWDDALRELKRDGQFQKVYRKWLLTDPPRLETRHSATRPGRISGPSLVLLW
ncbi:MAG TPA: ABC transporter substrate-binding protein [Janthinobacterium sp.]|jgi:polar amino acid transport system substrate-binding protein|nr:ABC transporter substrate-binding protein [Janthinobacterium sp.]